MQISETLMFFGYFVGVILGYVIMLFLEWHQEKVKQHNYRKFLSHNSAFWDPLDWSR